MVLKILFQQLKKRYCYSWTLHAKAIFSGFVLPRPFEYKIGSKLVDNNISIVFTVVAQPLVALFLFDVSKSAISKGSDY